MKRDLVLLMALPLMGCLADQQQQLARCMSEAEREYQNETWLLGNVRQSYVWLCMAAHGYKLNRLQNSCGLSISPMGDAAIYVQCYEPIGKFRSLIHRLEFALRRPPIK